MRVALVACCVVAIACGKRSSSSSSKDDAMPAPRDASVAANVAIRPLGLPDLASYGWRKRGGHPAFRVARAAENREDWPTVVTTCRQALTADPGHLEAAWLLAAALGKQGTRSYEELLGPLQLAVAGDFAKWGQASLELRALSGFLATPTGRAWVQRVEQDRNQFVATLARAVIVAAAGDLFAYDPDTTRWHRLTRTYGAVIGALRVPAANRIIYVTRRRVTVDGKKQKQFAVGIVDLARGRTGRPVELANDAPITIAYQTKTPAGVYIGTSPKPGARPSVWQRIDDNNKLVALPAKTARPAGATLEVKGRTVKLRAQPVGNVTADWDDNGLASALRIGKSHRIVSVPSPGLIDGSSVTWSGDRARLAFVAQLDDQCTPGALTSAAFVADAATGQLHELERAAHGIAVEWVTDRKVAVAGDKGVSILDLDTTAATPIEGAEGLVAPRQRPKCRSPEADLELEVDEPPDLTPEDP